MSFIILRNRQQVRNRGGSMIVASSGKKDPKSILVQTMQDNPIKNNIMGISKSMNKKDWKDSQGRSGKVINIL